MAPHPTLWPLEPHSKGKHEILRRYLHAWIPIMARHNGRLLLVDGFAGPGRYAGGEVGSPLILLDAFLSHRYRPEIKSEIVYLFIEERADRVTHLESEIAKLELPAQVKVIVERGRYEQLFRAGLGELQEKRRHIAPTFAFIDPFGYSDASMDLTGQFLEFKRCEVLIYMPLPYVARFVTRAGQEAAMTSLFGCEDWKKARDLAGDPRRQFLHDLFRDQLRASGSTYVRSFEIETAAGKGYHLFFGTRHELGLEKMKEAMWAVDPQAGASFRDSTNRDQLVLFREEVDTGPLLNDLHQHFGTQPFTVEGAERFTLLETAFVPGSHLKRRTLRPAEESGLLEVLTPRNKRFTYPERTKMRFLS